MTGTQRAASHFTRTARAIADNARHARLNGQTDRACRLLAQAAHYRRAALYAYLIAR